MKYEDINWYNINEHQNVLCLPDEVWRYSDVINNRFGLKEHFQVSSYGRCRRLGNKPFVFKITDNGAGYKKFALTVKRLHVNFYVHRVVAEAFHVNDSNLPQVNHKQTGLGKFDNRAEHLEWCSERENIVDAHLNGQMDYRTKVKTSIDIKSDEFVENMYRRYKETGKVGETAREFGVPRTSLSSIVNKRSRVYITDKIDKEYHSTITH